MKWLSVLEALSNIAGIHFKIHFYNTNSLKIVLKCEKDGCFCFEIIHNVGIANHRLELLT